MIGNVKRGHKDSYSKHVLVRVSFDFPESSGHNSSLTLGRRPGTVLASLTHWNDGCWGCYWTEKIREWNTTTMLVVLGSKEVAWAVSAASLMPHVSISAMTHKRNREGNWRRTTGGCLVFCTAAIVVVETRWAATL